MPIDKPVVVEKVELRGRVVEVLDYQEVHHHKISLLFLSHSPSMLLLVPISKEIF